MDREDHRRFMPPGYHIPENTHFDLICGICKHSISLDVNNRPSELCLATGIELDFLPDKNGPLIVIKCPNCKINMISVKKSKEIICKFCESKQLLSENYNYHINHKDQSCLQGIENGSLNSQTCTNCNQKNFHQFTIETGLMIYKIIRSINHNCRESEEYLENARTWAWLNKYQLSYKAFVDAELQLLPAVRNDNKMFNNYILMACVLDKLLKRDQVPYWFKRALTVISDEPMALKALGYSYYNLEKWDEAIDIFERIVFENIQVSDMVVDNLNLRLEAIIALEALNHRLGANTKTKYWERERKKITSEYPFLQR